MRAKNWILQCSFFANAKSMDFTQTLARLLAITIKTPFSKKWFWENTQSLNESQATKKSGFYENPTIYDKSQAVDFQMILWVVKRVGKGYT